MVTPDVGRMASMCDRPARQKRVRTDGGRACRALPGDTSTSGLCSPRRDPPAHCYLGCTSTSSTASALGVCGATSTSSATYRKLTAAPVADI